MAEEGRPIVIDNGSEFIKAGLAGEEKPHSTFPSIVGKPKYVASIVGSQSKDIYIGYEACTKGLLTLKYPIEKGIVENWDDMEKIWDYIFSYELHADSAEHPVLLTEAVMNTKDNRAKMGQIMFETFNVPSIYIGMGAALSLYSTGQKTGIVVHSGSSVTDVVPIIDNRPIRDSISSLNFGGRDLTVWMGKIMDERKIMTMLDNGKTMEIGDVFREMKEKLCYVSLNYDLELQKAISTKECEAVFTYEKTGAEITLNDERFRCPEILFRPYMNGFEFDGIQNMICNSINKCQKEIQNELYSNIFLSGGNTLFKGLPERLEKEIKLLAPEGSNVKITRDETSYSEWRGGSLLATSNSFKQQVVTHDMYCNEGPDICNAKFI